MHDDRQKRPGSFAVLSLSRPSELEYVLMVSRRLFAPRRILAMATGRHGFRDGSSCCLRQSSVWSLTPIFLISCHLDPALDNARYPDEGVPQSTSP